MRKLLSIFLILALLSGCSLAREDAGDGDGAGYADRMVGVFITEEYVNLFEIEQYLRDHPNDLPDGEIDGNTSGYEGRVYAVKEGERYVFPGLEGSCFFAEYVEEETWSATRSHSEGYISDGHFAYHHSDNGEEISLEGTVYVEQGRGGYSFYMNPVYQDKDGNLYLMAGSGMETNDLGECSQSLDSEMVTTVNGAATTYSCHVKVRFVSVPRTEKILLLQMDKNSAVLAREEYQTDDLPEQIEPAAGAEYLILEIHSAEGVTRQVYDRTEEFLTVYIPVERGILLERTIGIIWEEESPG